MRTGFLDEEKLITNKKLAGVQEKKEKGRVKKKHGTETPYKHPNGKRARSRNDLY